VRVRCFACDLSGDAFSLVAEVRGLDVKRDFVRVLDEARSLAGKAPPAPTPRRTDPEAPTLSDETYSRTWTHVLEFCSPMREISPHVAQYLDDREVYADAEAVDVRGLPLDGRALVTSLLSTFERTDLEAAQILRPGRDALDALDWPLLVPWRSRFGQLAFIQRRRLTDEKPKYLSPRGRSARAPFGVDLLGRALDALGPAAEVVLVEGALDALARRRVARHRRERCAVLGVYSASSPCAGLPLDLLVGRRVVLALDADKDGDRACEKLREALTGVAGELERERPAGGAKDWGQTLR
jgi:DNA primase